jgi:hypothetical protein
MNRAKGLGRACTFSVSDEGGGWRVLRGTAAVGDFHSRGDAIRAACFKARTAEKSGRRARVVAAPGDQVMPHYEPHFGL